MFSITVLLVFACKNNQTHTESEENASSSAELEETEGYVSLLTDTHFENGFMMRGLKLPIYGDPIETFGTELDYPMVPFQYEKEGLPLPEWNLIQFSTRYPFHDITNSSPHLTGDEFNYRFTDMGNGKYKYENYSKNIIKIFCNVFYLRFGTCLKILPGLGSKLVYLRRFRIF